MREKRVSKGLTSGPPFWLTISCEGYPRPRLSRSSLFTRTENGGYLVLAAGHGVLPLKRNRLARRASAEEPVASVEVRSSKDEVFRGTVRSGAISIDRDYALLELAAGDFRDEKLAEKPAHFGVRFDALNAGDRVSYFSVLERAWVPGTVARPHLTQVQARLCDGTFAQYGQVLPVRRASASPPFGRPGESGSLVFDSEGLAIGTLIGGGSDGLISHVLGWHGVYDALGSLFWSFFDTAPSNTGSSNTGSSNRQVKPADLTTKRSHH